MAVVIDLAPYLRMQRPVPVDPAGQVAEILLFMGVRYERTPEAEPVVAPAMRRRRSAAAKLAGAKSVRQPA